jgi:hypothetical protein
MPRAGSISSDIVDYLAGGRQASIQEIADALAKVRRSPVLRHSVRSALYQHMGESGERLFVRVGRAEYALRDG